MTTSYMATAASQYVDASATAPTCPLAASAAAPAIAAAAAALAPEEATDGRVIDNAIYKET
jgi:hypothetical protein